MTSRTKLLPRASVLLLISLAVVGCTAQPVAEPDRTSSPPPTESPRATATPTTTPTREAEPATCEGIVTSEYAEMAAGNGWVAWEMPIEGIGHNPFDDFPLGAPADSLSCRWGADPDLATDNVLDLAWSPIDAAASSEAQTYLEANGFTRIESPEGVYLAVRGEEGWADAEGWGTAYLFTSSDVRWATVRDQLQFMKSPSELD